ncbi:MAG TPA: ATP-binding protein [Longimicrobiaceae bacterium]
MRALLIEADGATRSRLRALLADEGWRPTVVASTETALDAFRAQPFPLVLLASRLPDVDGASLTKRIRSLPRGEEACVLVAHAGTPDDVSALVDAGADELLQLADGDAHLATRLAFARNRLKRGARSNAEDLVRVFERALRESEVRYRALFDQSPVGVFLCDRSLRINDINERLRQITGLPRGRMVGMSLRDALQPPVPGLGSAVADESASYDGPYLRPDGSQLWVTVRYAPLRDPDGIVVGGIGVVEDLSDRHRAEQRLHTQTAELERVNAELRERTLELEDAIQARSRLYTSMNHELRTPISAIMLYQELMMTGALGSLLPEQRQALERSNTATRHLLELVCDILDLSKLEAGRLVLHPSEVELDTLLRDLIGTMLPLTQRYGSQLQLEIETDSPRLVTDPQRVRQILLNLVSNAAKFGRGLPIRIRCRARETAVEIEVIDQGVGIDPADLERIFEDFVQVGSPPETGTGLGLPISRRLATLLDGTLEVESQPDAGSIFRLTLPAMPRAQAMAMNAAS